VNDYIELSFIPSFCLVTRECVKSLTFVGGLSVIVISESDGALELSKPPAWNLNH